MSEEVIVKEYPMCDFCDQEAHYDAKTRIGPWGYMCQKHYDSLRMHKDLGTGKGQRLVKNDAPDSRHSDPTVI